jgi:hypothetical protein
VIEMLVVVFAIYGASRLVLDVVDTLWPLR